MSANPAKTAERKAAQLRNDQTAAEIAEREGWEGGAVWAVIGSHRIHDYATRAGVRLVCCYSFGHDYRYVVAAADAEKARGAGVKVLRSAPSSEYRRCWNTR